MIRFFKIFVLLSFLIGVASNAFGAIVWDILDEQFDDLSLWQDHSLGSGYGEINPAGQLHLNSTVVADQNVGGITHFVPGGLPDIFIVEMRTLIDEAGFDTGGAHQLQLDNGNTELFIQLRKDGLFINDNFVYTEIGDNVVSEQVWQTWRFVINAPNPSATICDTYLDGTLLASGTPCSQGAPPVNDGLVYLGQYSYVTHTESHTDYIRIGTFDSSSLPIPEPSTMLLFSFGLFSLPFVRRKV